MTSYDDGLSAAVLENTDWKRADGHKGMAESGRTAGQPGAGSAQKSESKAARVRRKSIEAHGGGK